MTGGDGTPQDGNADVLGNVNPKNDAEMMNAMGMGNMFAPPPAHIQQQQQQQQQQQANMGVNQQPMGFADPNMMNQQQQMMNQQQQMNMMNQQQQMGMMNQQPMGMQGNMQMGMQGNPQMGMGMQGNPQMGMQGQPMSIDQQAFNQGRVSIQYEQMNADDMLKNQEKAEAQKKEDAFAGLESLI